MDKKDSVIFCKHAMVCQLNLIVSGSHYLEIWRESWEPFNVLVPRVQLIFNFALFQNINRI